MGDLTVQAGGSGVHHRSPILHHFSFIDALRGYAILCVVMVHCSQAIPVMGQRVRDATQNGVYGVQLFFVISAFTLFWSMRNRSRIDRKPLHAFFVRRIFRIGPLFWAGIVFYCLYPGPWRTEYAPHGVGWVQIAAAFLFLHGWYPTAINSIVPGGWSIGAEASFYAFMPLLYARVNSLAQALWIVLISTALVSAGSAPVGDLLAHFSPADLKPLVQQFVYFSFPSQFPVFAVGMVLYLVLLRQMKETGEEEWDRHNRAAFFLAAGVLLALGMIPTHIESAIAFAFIACGLASYPMRLFVNRATRFIGLISYSIYVWHFWVVKELAPRVIPLVHPLRSERTNGTLQFLCLFAVVLPPSIAIAMASYYIIELPGQRLGKRLIEKLNWGR
jgi:peptidoglycan/LPS O-acetylase OafA/YrhL